MKYKNPEKLSKLNFSPDISGQDPEKILICHNLKFIFYIFAQII